MVVYTFLDDNEVYLGFLLTKRGAPAAHLLNALPAGVVNTVRSHGALIRGGGGGSRAVPTQAPCTWG